MGERGALAGDILGKAFDQTMSTLDMVSSAEMGKKQFQEQKYMNRNQYQVAMADMRKAGLNPILAAGGGVHGSMQTHVGQGRGYKSTPSNFSQSTAALSQAQTANLAQIENAKVQKTQAEVNRTQAEVNKKTEKLTGEKQITEYETQGYLKAQQERTRQETRTQSALEQKINQEKLAEEYDNYRREAKGWMYKGWRGKVMSYAEWLNQMIFGNRGIINLYENRR